MQMHLLIVRAGKETVYANQFLLCIFSVIHTRTFGGQPKELINKKEQILSFHTSFTFTAIFCFQFAA